MQSACINNSNNKPLGDDIFDSWPKLAELLTQKGKIVPALHYIIIFHIGLYLREPVTFSMFF